MAEYRFSYKVGKTSCAKAHAQYILREGKYKYKEDMVYKESGNMFFTEEVSPIDFWKSADENERINGIPYREMELNIPNELSKEEGIELVKTFIKKELKEDYPFSFAIHESYNENGEKNTHCHLMFSERENDGIKRELDQFFKKANHRNPENGGAKKNRKWQKKIQLCHLRKSWEIENNIFLEKAGIKERVDCRSLKDRKLEALEKGDLKTAELLDRNSVNISGKILSKVKKIGYKNLSQEEKESFEKYKKAKEIKIKKEREYKIKTQQIVPTKEEVIIKLDKLAKIDEEELKRRTINILTKGKFIKELKELKRIETKLISNPTDIKLRSEEKKLQNLITNKTIENVGTKNYNDVFHKIKSAFEEEKTLYTKYLKENYKSDPTKELSEYNINKKKNEFEKKYEKHSTFDMKVRIKELENQDHNILTKQILSEYKLECISQEYLKIKNEKNLAVEKRDTLLMFGNKKELINKNKEIENFEKILNSLSLNSELILHEIKKNPLKEKELESRVKINAEIEMETLKGLLSKNNTKTITDKEIVQSNLLNFSELEKSKSKFNYYIENNLDNKFGKSIYKEKQKINALEDMLEESNKKVESIAKIDINKYIKEISEEEKLKISDDQNKLFKYEKSENKIKNILSNEKMSNGLTKTEMIALNKVTRGEYNLNSIEKKKLQKEIKEINDDIKNAGVLGILKKQSLGKKLEQKEKEYNNCISKEKILMKHLKGNHFADKLKDTNKIYENVLKKITKEKREIKSNLDTSLKLFKKTKELGEKEIKPISRNLRTKNLNINKNLNDLFRIFNVKQERSSHNNLKINLEKEEEWER